MLLSAVRSTYGRCSLFVASLLVALFAAAAPALATEEAPEYDKLTSGVKGEFLVIVPIVLAAIGVILGIAFAIRWGIRKFGGMH